MAAPRIIDYGRIEPGWRAGLLSVQQLADEYQEATGQAVTLTAINKHFKKLGIPRDLSAKIEAKAAAMVSAAMVSGKVSIDGTETLPAEAAIINSAATTSANVQLSHRADIKLLRMRTQQYQQELDECQDDLAKRVSILKSLSETQCRLIAAEREAFGMDKDAPADTGLSGESVATLRRMKAMLANG
ncbi:MAG: hypothetical protein IPK44_02980 [Candidatus Accumulibacter sp.]|uniref:hypothetical protein n=1 Tax=Accumulibacter sp. TaxID=2053492 RepID=UPI002588CBAE|nr:hypothetical protein [Accumulibacter sp.]MBK8113564.1 hypothetical protein [Accumulibacter sp.]